MAYKWLIDAGHGGIDSKGNYTTAPAKQFLFEDGLLIREGVINRLIANNLHRKLQKIGIDFALIHDEVKDLPLHTRAEIANKINAKRGNGIFLSIHSNAGKGEGFEFFTSKGETNSDKLVPFMFSAYKKAFPNMKFRIDMADGDTDKEENFTVLTATSMPAILVENLFFDNRVEADFLLSETGQEMIANTLLGFIEEVERAKPF
jgi:N-acetylmuramoyl-L-alanine amidase